MVRPRWLRQRERSNLFWLHTIVWIALHVGRPAARLLLLPITAYFLVFSSAARGASRDFLRRVLKPPIGLAHLFRHYYTFAATILDRVFVYTGRHDLFRLDVRGFELLEARLAIGQGCVLVGGHVGSVDLLRALGIVDKGLSIRAMMYPENAERIQRIFRGLNPRLCDDIIEIGRPDSLVDIGDTLQRGAFVALLGDRGVHGEKRARCTFLGSPAWFPEAPARLARMFEVPLIQFACLYRGNANYEVRFELLHDFARDPAVDLHTVIGRFAACLETLCRDAPYNWFNFYDFWSDDA